MTSLIDSNFLALPNGQMVFDHPGWARKGDVAGRAVGSHDDVWLVEVTHNVRAWHANARSATVASEAPSFKVFDASGLSTTSPVAAALCELGPVLRLRNPDLWDAVALAVIRQVVRAPQARAMYKRLCAAFGDSYHHGPDLGDLYLVPTAGQLLTLPDGALRELGLAFKIRPLRAAATAILRDGESWATMSPGALVAELMAVPGIGPWTAGAAVADYTNDFSVYPWGDLAVRTWAARLDPSVPWSPDQSCFERAWKTHGGDDLGTLTMLTLAWGSMYGSRE